MFDPEIKHLLQQKEILERDFSNGESGLTKVNQSCIKLHVMLVEAKKEMLATNVGTMTPSLMLIEIIQDLNLSSIDIGFNSLILAVLLLGHLLLARSQLPLLFLIYL